MNNNPLMKIDPDRCMKCGFCMSSCPVYTIDHLESHVARGRNMLVRMTRQGDLPMDDDYKDSLYACLLCKRCEAVCPANIACAEIAVNARHEVLEKNGMSWLHKKLYEAIVSRRSSVARFVGLASLIPGISVKGGRPLRHLADMAYFVPGALSLPKFSSNPLRRRVSNITRPAPGKKELGEVALFPGCIYEYFMPEIGEDIILSLAGAGYTVVLPEGLNCCGQSVRNEGDFETSRLLAEKNIEALDGYGHIITGCATCGSALKAYYNWFKEGDPNLDRCVEFSKKVSDFSEFLAAGDIDDLSSGYEDLTVTYHDPCHLRVLQGVYNAPREILNAIEGIRYVEMENADACCGLGGSFSIAYRDISLEILSNKIESIRRTGAQAVVTSCPGCMFYLEHGMRKNNMDVKVMHISKLTRGNDRQGGK